MASPPAVAQQRRIRDLLALTRARQLLLGERGIDLCRALHKRQDLEKVVDWAVLNNGASTQKAQQVLRCIPLLPHESTEAIHASMGGGEMSPEDEVAKKISSDDKLFLATFLLNDSNRMDVQKLQDITSSGRSGHSMIAPPAGYCADTVEEVEEGSSSWPPPGCFGADDADQRI